MCRVIETLLQIHRWKEVVELREKVFGYYRLDTTEMDCAIYNIWFELTFADTVEISNKMQLQIY